MPFGLIVKAEDKALRFLYRLLFLILELLLLLELVLSFLDIALITIAFLELSNSSNTFINNIRNLLIIAILLPFRVSSNFVETSTIFIISYFI